MKIAVLLATYNGEKYIEQLLDSLLNQSIQIAKNTAFKHGLACVNNGKAELLDVDYQIYIHDDGSSDGTNIIISEYAKKNDNINILEGPACGSPKANFMWMLSQVEADYYMFADQDDVWDPLKTVRLYDAISTIDDRMAASFCDMYVTDDSLNVISDSFIRYIGRSPKNTAYTQIIIDNPAAGCAMMINKALRDKSIELKDIALIPMHDHFILLLAAIYGAVEAVDMPLVYYRQTGNNQMGAVHESKLDKVKRNIADALTGQLKAKKTAFIGEAKSLARVVLQYDDLPCDKAKVLREFVDIDKKTKSERISFYENNNFTRESGNSWMKFFV